MTLLVGLLVGDRYVYSQHKLDVGKTRQRFHVTLKLNVERKKQRPNKVPLHLKEKLEKLLTQVKVTDTTEEMGKRYWMG